MSESDRPLDEDGFLLAHEPAEEGRPDDRIDDERMDEENTFKPEFVRAVEDALEEGDTKAVYELVCLLYTSPSPRDATLSRMPSSA